jgi:hypothetical protein
MPLLQYCNVKPALSSGSMLGAAMLSTVLSMTACGGGSGSGLSTQSDAENNMSKIDTAPVSLGDFESPAMTGSGFQYAPSGTGWKFFGTTGGGVQKNGSPWGASNAPEGQQTAFLQGGDSHVSKAVTLPAGVYNISFYAAQRPYDTNFSNSSNPIQVKVNGINIGSVISPDGINFKKYTTSSFPLSTPGEFTIELVSTNGKAGDFTTFIDNVTVEPVSGAAVGANNYGNACANFYTSDFKLDDSRTILPIASLANPAKGQTATEPAFKTCLTRASDLVADGSTDRTYHSYSRHDAFNADSSRYALLSGGGTWKVYDAKTYKVIQNITGAGSFDGLRGDNAELQWHPTNPDALYYLPGINGSGMKLNELTVSTKAIKTLGDFGPRVKAMWPGASAVWTGSEGSSSKDGRYWCFMAAGNSGTLGIFTWDRDQDKILGSVNASDLVPDNVSMSPSGNYCVVSGNGAKGTVAYSRDFSESKTVLRNSQHSDLAIDANGDDVYVGVDEGADAEVFMFNLRTGVRTFLMPTRYNGYGTSSASLFSGKAFKKPGWVLVNTYAEGAYGGTPHIEWMHRKIMAVQLSANPQIYNLAFHRSAYSGNYDSAPKAAVNGDFTKIIFNSNWQDGGPSKEAYIMEIPADALKATTTAPGGSTTSPSTPTPPVNAPLAITVGKVTHKAYDVSYVLTTNQVAKCRATFTDGVSYDYLYDDIPTQDGLTHTKTIGSYSTQAHTLYASCKATASNEMKQVAISVPASAN